ncbi:TPA: hypothetical protein ACSPZX_003575 [Aeromonas veronii]
MFLHRKIVEKSIRNIHLDIDNPRLIGLKKRDVFKTQNEIMRVLVEHYDVLSICRSILREGYHLDEILITIPNGESSVSSVVVEGNRRLCACKILIKPDILKGTSSYAAVKRLTKDVNYEAVTKTLSKLNVVELPNRLEAASYLASKHTQSPIKSWSVYTQGAYYISVKDEANVDTLSEVNIRLNRQVSLQRIKQVVFFFRLSEYIIEMPCWDVTERKALLDNIDSLKIEAILRLINTKEFRNKVGLIKIDEAGLLNIEKMSFSDFEKIMEKLTRDAHFATTENDGFVLSTRQEDKTIISNYIKSIVAIKDSGPDSKNNEKGAIVISVGSSTTSEPKEIEKKSSPSPSKRTRKIYEHLLDSVQCRPNLVPKLDEMVDEALRINVVAQKYSSVLLSRAIIEITIKSVIKKSGLEAEIRTAYRDRAWDFENLLKFTNENIRSMSQDDSIQKAIKGAITSLLTHGKDVMNLTNHNEIQSLSEQRKKPYISKE